MAIKGHTVHKQNSQSSQRKTSAELLGWTETQAIQQAKREGINMQHEHWEVVNTLRLYYLNHGLVSNSRELSDMLEKRFSKQGGRQYLYRLFPKSPVESGMRIAGLPVPPQTDKRGCGSGL